MKRRNIIAKVVRCARKQRKPQSPLWHTYGSGTPNGVPAGKPIKNLCKKQDKRKLPFEIISLEGEFLFIAEMNKRLSLPLILTFSQRRGRRVRVAPTLALIDIR